MQTMTRSLIVALAALLVLAVPAAGASAQAEDGLAQSVTEDKDQGNPEGGNSQGGGSCQSVQNVSDPVRAGKVAFRHEVENCGERAEIAMDRTRIGQTQSEGWAIYLPEDWENDGETAILNQWAAYPSPINFRDYCGGVGPKMSFGGSGGLSFGLPVPYEDRCESFPVAHADDMAGEWTDFVLISNWHEDGGFLKLYVRIGAGEWEQVIDHKGATWFPEEVEGDGPYFKMGLYTGDPGNGAGVLYTDEYRRVEGEDFDAVAPGGGAPPAPADPPAPPAPADPPAPPAPADPPAPPAPADPQVVPAPSWLDAFLARVQTLLEGFLAAVRGMGS